MMSSCMLFAKDFDLENYSLNKKLIGSGSLEFLFFRVYDASLFATKKPFSFEQTFSLEMSYKMDISGQQIADSSAEEIAKLGFDNPSVLEAWHQEMLEIFVDVEEGDRLIGVRTDAFESIFYLNGQELGSIEDRDFSQWFFAIWLSENTSEPELRRGLLGL